MSTPPRDSVPSPGNLEGALNQGIAFHRDGNLENAETVYRSILDVVPDHADALNLLGTVRAEAGAPEEGLEWIRLGVQLRPDQPVFLNSEGLTLLRLDRPDEAHGVLERAVRFDSTLPEAWLNLGTALLRLSNREEANHAFTKALKLDPEHAQANYSFGCMLLEDGDLEGALPYFQQTLATSPEHVDASINLGLVLYQKRMLDEAEAVFRRVLARQPEDTRALNNLGQVLRRKGDAIGALELLWKVVQMDTEDAAAWSAFTEAFRDVRFGDDADVEFLLNVLLMCLLQDGIDHRELAGQAVRIFRHDPMLCPLLGAADEKDDATLDERLSDPIVFAALARPVVRLALKRTILPDVELERVFTAARRHALRTIAGGIDLVHPEVVGSLARQCFRNGYVWSYTEEEVALIEEMVASLADRRLGSDRVDFARIAMIACYVPLIEWERAEDVAALAEAAEQEFFLGLVRQQIVEPYREILLRECIPTLGPIENDISEEVRTQYEEHPYPRWTSVNRPRAASVGEVMRELFPRTPIPGSWNDPRILVAGCGTGKQLLDIALRFAGADVVGIDLSLSSLSYAVRKAEEVGCSDLRLMQGDILSLADWDETFDIISCGGVLHHMEDPVAGWRILVDHLRPGGLMNIGLYSELARESIVDAQELIAREGFEATEDGIRQARPRIVEHFKDRDGGPRKWRDFYSLEECRDLLFHVQEHRFTLPRIAEILDELGLEFLGFQFASMGVLDTFRARFSEVDAERSLNAWHAFETDNPDTFSGMYQFWVRKPE